MIALSTVTPASSSLLNRWKVGPALLAAGLACLHVDIVENSIYAFLVLGASGSTTASEVLRLPVIAAGHRRLGARSTTAYPCFDLRRRLLARRRLGHMRRSDV